MAEVAVDERRLLKTIRWWDGFVIGLANPGFLLIGLWGSIIALGGQVAIILWIISACIGALQAYIYCEPAAMFPDKPGGLSVYAREGWRKHFSFAGPIAVFGYWFAWSSVLAIYGSLIGYLLIAEFAGDGYFATTTWSPPIIQPARMGAADRSHVHRALLGLQHPRHATRRRAQLRRRGADDHPDPRDRHRRLRHRRLRESRDQLELRRRERRVLRRFRDVLQPVRDDHGLAVHPGLVDLRAGGRGDVRAGVQGHGERHPQGPGLGGCAQRRPLDHAPDRRPRDDRLRRPLQRH